MYGLVLLVWYLLVRELTRSESLARIALLILAVYPNHLAYSSLVASEVLALLLVTSGLQLMLIARRHPLAALPAGLLFGVAALVRPVLLLLPLTVGVVELVAEYRTQNRRALRTAARSLVVLHVVMAAVLVPWLARNHAVFGHFVLANEGGVTLLVGNNPHATGGWRMDERVRRLVPETGNEYEDATRKWNFGFGHAREHPGRTLALIPKKVAYLYAVDHDGAAWNLRGMHSSRRLQRFVLRGWAALSDVFYWLIALAALWTLWRARPSFPRMGTVALVFFTAVYLPFFGTSRFHFFTIPWFVLGAAAFITRRARPAPV